MSDIYAPICPSCFHKMVWKLSKTENEVPYRDNLLMSDDPIGWYYECSSCNTNTWIPTPAELMGDD